MHIPDGYLDPVTSGATYVIFLSYLLPTLKSLKLELTPEKTSIVAVLAATIFVAQMLNWPIPGGTSLHFVGSGLAGIMLGPKLGFMVMFLVLLIQCVLFHDGGITTLGANVLNMGIIGVVSGYTIFKALYSLRPSRLSRLIASFIAGWLSMTLAGAACGIEIGVSPLFGFNLNVTLPIMVSWHAALGLIEGAITALVVDYVASRSPNLIYLEQ